MRLSLVPALLFAIAFAVPAQAAECIPTTSVTDDRMIVLDLGVQEPFFLAPRYIANDVCNVPTAELDRDTRITIFATTVSVPARATPGECIFSIWTYYETNDIEGLQRGDEVHDDTCRGLIESDTIPF